MSKTVQIDTKLFKSLCDFFFDKEVAPEGYEADEIRNQLNEKLDKMISRALFSKYKRTPTGVEREQARKEYLEYREISEDFRTDTEQHEPDF